MRLTFPGGAGPVTGSRYLCEHGNQRVRVDCGLLPGSRPAAGG
jgi:metallo-beta-lactamase family protein